MHPTYSENSGSFSAIEESLCCFQYDSNGYVTHVNHTMCELLGYEQPELTTHLSVLACLTISTKEILQNNISGVIEKDNKGVVRVTLEFISKKGVGVWLYTTIVQEKKKNTTSYVCVGVDITTLKESEQNIKKRIQKKESLLNRISDGIVSVDNQWRYTYMNQPSLYAHPKGFASIAGKTIWEVHPEMHGTIFWEKYHEAMETKRVVEVEAYYEPFERWINVKVYPGDDGLTFYYRDITEQRKNELLINEEQRLSESIVNSLPGVFYLYDQQGKFKKWNQNIGLVTGYTEEQISQMHPLDLIPEHDKELVRKKIQEVFESGHAEVESELQTIDGKCIPYFFNGYKATFYGVDYLIGMGIDLTERKQAEQKRQETELSYRTLIEQASDGVCIVSSELQLLDINNSGCELLGYTREECMKLRPEDIFVAEDIANKPLQIAELKAGKSVHNERRFKRKDGSYVEVEISGKQMEDGRHIFFARDITERKNAERKEAEITRRLKAIFDGTSDAVILVDNNSKCIQANTAAYQLFQYTEQEFSEISLKSLISERNVDVLWTSFQENGKQEGSIELIRKDNSPVFCEYKGIKDILPGLHLFILNDVTERKQAQLEIQESERKYQLLFQNNPLPMWMVSIPGFMIVDVNDAAVGLYGYTREEFLTMNAVQLRPKDEYNKFESYKQSTTREHSYNSGIWKHQKKSGEILYAEIITHDIVLNNENLRIILANDVTEKRQAEIELKKSEASLAEAQALSKVGNWETDLITLDVTWSAQTYKIFGVNPAEAEPTFQMFLDCVHPEDKPLLQKALEESNTYTSMQTLEHRVVTSDQEIKYIEERWQVIRDNNNNAIKAIGTSQDVTDRKKAEEAIRTSQEALRELSAHLQTIREDERTAIAREIHDELGQQLTALKMDASWVLKKMPAYEHQQIERLQDMIALIDDTVTTIRRISSLLRPGILDDLGLVAALEWQNSEFKKRTGILCEFYSSATDINLDSKIAIGVFRVYQEALTNVMRHAEATHLFTALESKNGILELTVVDNGVGFDLAQIQHRRTLGITGMKERALMFGGQLSINSQPNIGTRLQLTVPIRSN